MTFLVVVAGVMAGLGLLLLVRSVAPARQDLAVAVGRFDQSTARFRKIETDLDMSLGARAGRRVLRALAARGIDLTGLRPDLEITGNRLDVFVGKTVLLIVAALVLPGLIGPVIGMSIDFSVLAGLLLAVVIGLGRVRDLRSSARQRRGELVGALATYLGLLSMSLGGHDHIETAMVRSVRLGRGWAFELIARTIERANRVGDTPWEHMGELGERVGLPELVDLASALTLVGQSSAKVRTTLAARAASMRARQLAEIEAAGQIRTDNLVMTQILMVFGFIILLGYVAFASIVVAVPN